MSTDLLFRQAEKYSNPILPKVWRSGLYAFRMSSSKFSRKHLVWCRKLNRHSWAQLGMAQIASDEKDTKAVIKAPNEGKALIHLRKSNVLARFLASELLQQWGGHGRAGSRVSGYYAKKKCIFGGNRPGIILLRKAPFSR